MLSLRKKRCPKIWWTINWKIGSFSVSRLSEDRWLKEKYMATSLRMWMELPIGKNFGWLINCDSFKCSCKTKNYLFGCMKRSFHQGSTKYNPIWALSCKMPFKTEKSLRAWILVLMIYYMSSPKMRRTLLRHWIMMIWIMISSFPRFFHHPTRNQWRKSMM